MQWALAVGVVLISTTTTAAPHPTCPPSRYLIAQPLIPGPNAPTSDELNIREVGGIMVASINSGGCPLGAVKLTGKKRFTKVTAKFTGCTEAGGPVVVKARIAAPECNGITGKTKAKRARVKSARRTQFSGVRGPNFVGPSGIVVGAIGGTYDNPDDGTRVVIPPGAFSGSATVGVFSPPAAEVALMDQVLGVSPPPGVRFLASLQVVTGPIDSAPRSSLVASVLATGSPSGTLIHTVTEPTFVNGFIDDRAPRLIYDGAVEEVGGRYEMRVSSQSFGSPPGLSRVAEVGPQRPTCFVDGVVRDSNGSPAPFAFVEASGLPGLAARANVVGFYRAVVTQGHNALTASNDAGTGSTIVTCDAQTTPRITAVDIVVEVPAVPGVPVVAITDPAMDETIAATVRVIEGTVSPTSIGTVTVVSQSGDFADLFTQTAPVTDGSFSATVILSPGRENTIVVVATDEATGLAGADSAVITVTGAAGEDLRFTMTWNTNTTDVDLHVRVPGGNGIPDTTDGDTIYFTNRTVNGGTLDVDDTDGFGPENIVFPVGVAPIGTYAFAAHYWRGAPTPTSVTVSVFVDGFLRGSFTRTLTMADSGTPLAGQSPQSVFNIGTITLPGGTIGEPAEQSVFVDGPE
jgi:uncharacterized protein YfaP (DUF2135 family)